MTNNIKGNKDLLHDDQNIVDAVIYTYEALDRIARHIDESDIEGICIALAGEQLREPVGPALNNIADAIRELAEAIRKGT